MIDENGKKLNLFDKGWFANLLEFLQISGYSIDYYKLFELPSLLYKKSTSTSSSSSSLISGGDDAGNNSGLYFIAGSIDYLIISYIIGSGGVVSVINGQFFAFF